VLSKLIYHLIHCLIYRPFLPIDLAELAGTGQHQSWQIEATNLCFLHANAIAELVELGKQSSSIEWPAFVGYCICTAGTVHVHGAHYKGGREGEVFSSSTDFLSREMQQLSELRYAWSSVQHQRETLQTIYGCHSELVKSLASNPMRYSPVFHLEDFFDRYSDLGQFFDGAHISFADILLDPTHETYTGHDIYASRSSNPNTLPTNGNHLPGVILPSSSSTKQRKSSTSARKKHELKAMHRNSVNGNGNGVRNRTSSELISPHTMVNGNMMHQQQHQSMIPQSPQQPQTPFSITNGGMPTLSQTPFSPPYAFSSLNAQESYDPMLGMPNLNNSIPSSVHGGTGGYAGYSMEGQEQSGMNDGNVNGNGQGEVAMTPGARSNGSTESGEKDPFLSLLEQLAENEHSRGGPSELDFFLSGGNG